MSVNPAIASCYRIFL